MDAAVASPDGPAVFYNPRVPARWMRNRVIEATTSLEKQKGLGSWGASEICKRVFRPSGIERHRHLRALLCNAADFLGWLGTLMPDTPAPHHHRLLSALLPTFQRRLLLERRMAEAQRSFGALDLAMERIGAPAFIVDARGVIVAPNAAARTLLSERRSEIAEALAAARTGRPHPVRIELTRLAATGVSTAWLALVRVESQRIAHALARARDRWELTARQQDVLEKIVEGESTATIAAMFDISTRAVEQHVTALLQRADVDNRASLVAQVLLA